MELKDPSNQVIFQFREDGGTKEFDLRGFKVSEDSFSPSNYQPNNEMKNAFIDVPFSKLGLNYTLQEIKDWADSNSFILYVDGEIVDITVAAIVWFPADSATGVAITVAPTATFSESVLKVNGLAVEDSDIVSLFELKETDENGSDVSFTGTIDSEKKVVTITPDASLSNSQAYYLAIKDGVVKDAGDNLVPGESVTFTTTA